MSARISSRVDGEIYRSLSRERRSGYRTLRARSGSRERMEDRGQRSEERGRRADSSGPCARIPRPSPSPTGTGSNAAVVISNIVNHTVLQSLYSHLIFSQAHGFPALTRLLTSRTDSAGRKRQKSKSWFPPFIFYSMSMFMCLSEGNNGWNSYFVRQRKVRRDMLASPIVPERGRSRSREAYPQMARSSSRGRSLSVERRGSRNSSESSLVDMEEMAQTLFR